MPRTRAARNDRPHPFICHDFRVSYLAGLATGLRQEGVTAEVAVAFGEAIDGILTEMELHSVDLVVMSTHGRSGLSRMLGGSVAQGLLTRSPVPVLLVPPNRR